MEKGTIQVICGNGTGKTNMAIGAAIQAAAHGKTVVIVQFLKGSQPREVRDYFKKLEPDIRVFSFEKQGEYFEKLDAAGREEALGNIRNGIGFAKKVLTTGECDLLILDEFLGIIDQKLVTAEQLSNLFSCRDNGISLILTGIKCPEDLLETADSVVDIENRKKA